MFESDNPTIYARTDYELEEFLLFSIMVAGKTAKTTQKALARFLGEPDHRTPIGKVYSWIMDGSLEQRLKDARTGNYTKLIKAFKELFPAIIGWVWDRRGVGSTTTEFIHPFRTVTIEELESIHGIGPKTSRFFILHSREGERLAVLDTHILKWLAKEHPDLKIPKSTPSGTQYKTLEQVFLADCDRLRRTPAELDLEIWLEYRKP